MQENTKEIPKKTFKEYVQNIDETTPAFLIELKDGKVFIAQQCIDLISAHKLNIGIAQWLSEATLSFMEMITIKPTEENKTEEVKDAV